MEQQSTTTEYPYQRRNFMLGVLNGIFFEGGIALSDSALVLATFVSQLTTINFWVSFAAFIMEGGWLLPQLIASGHMQRQPRLKKYYIYAAWARIILWGSLTLSAFVLRGTALLIAFLTFLTLYSIASGVAAIPFLTVIGKTVSPRHNGALFAWRHFLGGLLALGGSFLVRYLLSENSGLSFPFNYGVILALTWVVFTIGLSIFMFAIEPIEDQTTATAPRSTLGQLKFSLPILRRDKTYRIFLMARLMLVFCNIATPFYAIYAHQKLGLPLAWVGIYLMTRTLAGILSALLWGKVSDNVGNQMTFRLSAILGLIAPLIPFVVSAVNNYYSLTPTVMGIFFAGAFLLDGLQRTGVRISGISWTLELAPAAQRPVYIGFTNTALGLSTLSLSMGGLLVDLAGFNAVFILSAAFFALAVVFNERIHESRRGRET